MIFPWRQRSDQGVQSPPGRNPGGGGDTSCERKEGERGSPEPARLHPPPPRRSQLGDGVSRAGAGTKCTALALGGAASLIPPARGCSVLPCPAPLPRAHARRFQHRLHPATSTPSCPPARLALRPTSWVVAISVSLLDIINPISLRKSPLLALSPPGPSIPSTFARTSVRARYQQAIRAARSQPKHTVLAATGTSPRGSPPQEPQVGT